MITPADPQKNSPRPASHDRNVLDTPLQPCSTDPMTGFTRNGCCENHPSDHSSHTVCAVMTAAFLDYTRSGQRPLHPPARIPLPRPPARRPLVPLCRPLARSPPCRRCPAHRPRSHECTGPRRGQPRNTPPLRLPVTLAVPIKKLFDRTSRSLPGWPSHQNKSKSSLRTLATSDAILPLNPSWRLGVNAISVRAISVTSTHHPGTANNSASVNGSANRSISTASSTRYPPTAVRRRDARCPPVPNATPRSRPTLRM